eukprot:scaffold8019_cov133-Isochrysis_galbana.AAC.6
MRRMARSERWGERSVCVSRKGLTWPCHSGNSLSYATYMPRRGTPAVPRFCAVCAVLCHVCAPPLRPPVYGAKLQRPHQRRSGGRGCVGSGAESVVANADGALRCRMPEAGGAQGQGPAQHRPLQLRSAVVGRPVQHGSRCWLSCGAPVPVCLLATLFLACAYYLSALEVALALVLPDFVVEGKVSIAALRYDNSQRS